MKVGKTGTAGPHAAYIFREGKYVQRLAYGEKLEATEAGNMPVWARQDAQQFWQAGDANERGNGTIYREMEIALPRELRPEQRAALVREFVRQEIGEKHPYQWAIHTPQAADGQERPHVHLMFSERQQDGIERDPEQYFKRYNAKAPEKGGARKGYGQSAGQTLTDAERAAQLKALRGRWQDMANQHLERAGLAEQIDMRSHAERGTGQQPEVKQLPSQWRGQGRANVIEFRQARREQAAADNQVRQAIPNMRAEIISLEAERQRLALAAQERQDAQSQAERQRIERMSAAELRAEIARLQPPWFDDVVKRQPEMVAASQHSAALKEQGEQERSKAEQANTELQNWRSAHPLRAKMHDAGLLRSSVLLEIEQRRRQAKIQWHWLAPRIDAAFEHEGHIRNNTQARVAQELAAVWSRVAELKRIERHKASQEGSVSEFEI